MDENINYLLKGKFWLQRVFMRKLNVRFKKPNYQGRISFGWGGQVGTFKRWWRNKQTETTFSNTPWRCLPLLLLLDTKHSCHADTRSYQKCDSIRFGLHKAVQKSLVHKHICAKVQFLQYHTLTYARICSCGWDEDNCWVLLLILNSFTAYWKK